MNPDHRVLQQIRAEYPGRLPHGLLRLLAREGGVLPNFATSAMHLALAAMYSADCLPSASLAGSAGNSLIAASGLTDLAHWHSLRKSGRDGGNLPPSLFNLSTAIPTCSMVKIDSSSPQHFFTSSAGNPRHASAKVFP